jgi:sensor histidine kinase YesM
MEKYPFIFSDERQYRLKRHFLFWVMWWLFQSFLYSFSAGLLNVGYFERLPVSTIESFFYLAPHIFLSYSLMYFVVPRFVLKARYVKAVLAAMSMIFLTAAISSVISIYLLSYLRTTLLGKIYVPPHHVNEVYFFLGLLAGLRGALTVGGIAAAIKLMKYWYVKEQRNLQLQKENISSQLQLLKAQVHPHFLFNTLNNIYSSAQVTSPAAANMIVSLSQLLRYMLYEGNQPTVLLSRELKMLAEYMQLEKSRYGNGLDLNVKMPVEETGLSLAPLLLLPFVENCFKHGTSQVLEQPWISLHIAVEEDWLKMKLVNGKTEESTKTSSGIGLSNVQKRLQLLYPNRHELLVTNEEEVFIVNLKLQLEKTAATVPTPVAATLESYA